MSVGKKERTIQGQDSRFDLGILGNWGIGRRKRAKKTWEEKKGAPVSFELTSRPSRSSLVLKGRQPAPSARSAILPTGDQQGGKLDHVCADPVSFRECHVRGPAGTARVQAPRMLKRGSHSGKGTGDQRFARQFVSFLPTTLPLPEPRQLKKKKKGASSSRLLRSSRHSKIIPRRQPLPPANLPSDTWTSCLSTFVCTMQMTASLGSLAKLSLSVRQSGSWSVIVGSLHRRPVGRAVERHTDRHRPQWFHLKKR